MDRDCAGSWPGLGQGSGRGISTPWSPDEAASKSPGTLGLELLQAAA